MYQHVKQTVRHLRFNGKLEIRKVKVDPCPNLIVEIGPA